MTDRELLQMALDMLDDINQCSLPPTGIPLPAEIDHVMEALRARLAQPEPEPVAWISHNAGLYHGKPDESLNPLPLYTAPPQREWMEQERAVGYREGHQAALKQRVWQGLTDEEYEAMAEQYVTNCYFDTLKYAKAIEAKLKDNNYDND